MRTVKLDLEELEVETTVVEPVFVAPEGLANPEGYLASILWDTTGRQIPRLNTNESSCYA